MPITKKKWLVKIIGFLSNNIKVTPLYLNRESEREFLVPYLVALFPFRIIAMPMVCVLLVVISMLSNHTNKHSTHGASQLHNNYDGPMVIPTFFNYNTHVGVQPSYSDCDLLWVCAPCWYFFILVVALSHVGSTPQSSSTTYLFDRIL